MAPVHLAHFPGTVNDSMESLCGRPGMCSSNPKAIDCSACLVIIDWALENGLYAPVPGVPNFWVVNGTPPRGICKDDRDGYEFWYSNTDPVRIKTVKTQTVEESQMWRSDLREWVTTPARVVTWTEYQMVYATAIPRPYIGRDAPEFCKMRCPGGSERGLCPCKRPLDCFNGLE